MAKSSKGTVNTTGPKKAEATGTLSINKQLEANKGKPHSDAYGRMPHPLLKVDQKGDATVTLEAVPEDFDDRVHRPLRKDDFKQEHVYLRAKADLLQKDVDKLRARANVVEKTGGTEHGKSLGKILKLQSTLGAEIAALKAAGVDVETLLSEIGGNVDKE